MSRVIIVANRLPLSVRPTQRGELRFVSSAGGLATALRSVRGTSVWIGWPGELPRMSRSERVQLDKELGAANLIPVHLSAAEIARYYDGFSNGVLWPLLHYLIESVHLQDSANNFDAYVDVNRRFAERTAAIYQRGVLVLSELAGAAAELREGALVVNPYDLGGIVSALKQALTMSPEHQAIRMRAMRRRVARVDVHRWARRFLRALGHGDEDGGGGTSTTTTTSSEPLTKSVGAVADASA